MYQIIWHNRMSRDRERTTRKQKAQIIWRHKFPNIKFWETLSERDTASAVPPSTIGMRAGLLRDNRQNCPRVVQSIPGICSASLRQGPNRPLNNPARVPMVEGGTADAVSLSEGSRWWEAHFTHLKCGYGPSNLKSCARTPVSCTPPYTGTRARITCHTSAHDTQAHAHEFQGHPVHSESRLTAMRNKRSRTKTVSLRNELYDNNNIDDASTVPINDELSRRAETCCKSAFSALFDKQNCNKLLLREPPFKT